MHQVSLNTYTAKASKNIGEKNKNRLYPTHKQKLLEKVNKPLLTINNSMGNLIEKRLVLSGSRKITNQNQTVAYDNKEGTEAQTRSSL